MLARLARWYLDRADREAGRRRSLVKDILGNREMEGRDLREELARRGLDLGGPAFYAMMADLEDAGHVQGWYNEQFIGGIKVKKRMYRR